MASVEIEGKKKALGRGLGALIPGMSKEDIPEPTPSQHPSRKYFECDIEKIVPNTYQPRKIFDKEALEELAESIKVHGIIQPIMVRQRNGQFEIIAGERRWRAAQKAGLQQVPVVVKELEGDKPSLELAIIENIQREELNCIEEAIAYQQLMDEFQLSQEEISKRIGKSRTAVANTLRLLKLPAVIREDIADGRLSMGHARALLAIESTEEQLKLRELVVKKKLSVRETERKVNEVLNRGPSTEEKTAAKLENPHLKQLEDELRQKYAVGVKIAGSEEKGTIQFSYVTRDDLMRISDILKGQYVST